MKRQHDQQVWRDAKMEAAVWVLIPLCVVLLTARGHAQTGAQTTAAPSFEVASVKINTSGDVQVRLSAPPGSGRIDITNMMLRGVIQAAYQIQPFQLVNIPNWVLTQRIDIVAKADPSASFQDLRLMLQPLLAERFKLQVHRETRDLDIATLVLVNRNGSVGPHLKRSEGSCAAVANTPRDTLPAGGASERCGIIPSGPGHFVAHGFPINGLAALLSLTVGRQVIDQTGLEGGYDLDLKFTPEQFAAASLALRPGASAPAEVDPNGPSIFTAIQDQLGLKLESKKGPAEVLVIDRIEPLVGD